MIDIQGLDVVFGQGKQAFHAVRDVSLKVDKGQSFGLVGESGSVAPRSMTRRSHPDSS